MGFKPATQKRDNNDSGSDVDYKGKESHIVEACGTQDKHRTIPAYISGYYDLGKQPQQPYEALYNENTPKFDEMKKDVEEGLATIRYGNIYISENGSGEWHNDVDIFSKPRKAKKAIAWCVTFPQITVDIDPFFGGVSSPRPLNVIMGGETWEVRLDDPSRKEKCIQNIMYAQENTNNPSKTWGFGQTTMLHRMGNGLDILNEHNLLTYDKLGDFLGKPLQFRLRVWNKPSKKGGDGWYTEELKFVSEVPEGLPVPEFDSSFIHGINFNEENNPETVKALNQRVVNTMKRAEDFEGSIIQKELIAAGKVEGNKEEASTEGNVDNKPSEKPVFAKVDESKPAVATTYSEPAIDFDTDIPF